jgi:hypothetical protein
MTRIFISYRRSDSLTFTGRIYDRLVDAFGADNVFKDVDRLLVGVDFRSVINREIGSSDVLLAIVGPNWLDAVDEDGKRRLEDPNDFVRLELEFGLRRRTMLLVPVLIGGARMPTEDQLPPSMRDFAFRHAAIVREDPDFRGDISRLIEQITRFAKQNTATTAIPTSLMKPELLSGAEPAAAEYSSPVPREEPPTAALTREEVERQKATHAPPRPQDMRSQDMRTAPIPNLTMPPAQTPDPSHTPPPVSVPAPNHQTFTPAPPPTAVTESPRRSIDIRWVLAGIVILLLLAIILTLLASNP